MQDVGEMVPVAQEAVRQDLQAMFRGAIRASLELFLEAELEALVGAEWYARVGGRRDRRNGAYTRRLLTSLGQIDVSVPRTRDNGSPIWLDRFRRGRTVRHHGAAEYLTKLPETVQQFGVPLPQVVSLILCKS